MKRFFSSLVLVLFILTLFSPSDAAVKRKRKKTIKKRRYYSRRIVRNWPKGGPRPVFPTAGSNSQPKAAPAPPPAIAKPPANPILPPAKDYFFAEGGLAGGGGALEIGYARNVNEKLNLSGALGFAFFGNKNGVVLDLVRAGYNINEVAFAGAGISYAGGLPGLELFAGRRFDRWSARAGYNGALGFRLAAGYQF